MSEIESKTQSTYRVRGSMVFDKFIYVIEQRVGDEWIHITYELSEEKAITKIKEVKAQQELVGKVFYEE